MRNVGIDVYTIWLCVSPETLLSKNRVSLLHSRTIVLYSACGRWYLSHVSTRNVSCAIYKTRRPTYRSRFCGRGRPCAPRCRAVNSYRKLIQDNYRDMKCWSILIAGECRRTPFLSHCTILQRVAPTNYRIASRDSHKCREYFVSAIAAINIPMRPLLISLIAQKIWELSNVSCIINGIIERIIVTLFYHFHQFIQFYYFASILPISASLWW